MDNIKEEGIKVEGLSDDELDEQLKENLGVVDEKETGEETPADSSPEEKTNEGDSPSSQGEKDKEDDEKNEEKKKKEEESKATESKNTEDEKEKEAPFHKHPRFQKLVRAKNEAEEKNKGYESRLHKLENPPKEEKLSPIPTWFAGDENEWLIYNREQEAKEQRIIETTLGKVAEQNKLKENKVEKMEKWVDDEIDKLQDDPDVEEFKRNELLKVMTENRPTDENGNLDFKRGYDLMIKLQSKKENKVDKKETDEKKKIVSTDTGSDGGGGGENKVVTADDIRHKSFGQLTT